MDWLVPLVLFSVVIVHVTRQVLRDRSERKGYPLPPGPPALPIIGSALSVNAKLLWLTFTEWRAKYGECPLDKHGCALLNYL